MSRLRAFFVHFSLSVAIVGAVFAVVFFVWYPQPYFEVVGAWYPIRILVIVDVILGPILTLIIFKAGKPGLRFDLSIIALIQVAALIYGTTIIYQERPYFLVYSVDRFELVPKKDIDLSKIRYESLTDKPLIGAIPVFARLPEDRQALSDFTTGVILEGKPDLERRAEFWHPYKEHASEIEAEARDLSELLTAGGKIEDQAARVKEKYQADHPRLGFVPLMGRTETFSMLLDLDTGETLEVLDIDPYQLMTDQRSRTQY